MTYIDTLSNLKKASNTEFYLKNGDLTVYGLHCGYVQRKKVDNKYVTLFHEHSTYHVQGGTSDQARSFWESFDTLSEARKFYKKQVKEIL